VQTSTFHSIARRSRIRAAFSQYAMHAVFIVISIASLYPLFLVIGISFSDEITITLKGFSMIPHKVSYAAYEFILKESNTIFRAYFITIATTVVGTIASTLTIALYAYPLSRKDFKQRKIFAFIAFFTMLFSGGMVPWYIVCKTILGLRNNIWALFLPYLMNAWFVMIMRTFFKTNIPDSIIESAKMDGASEYRIFFQIVLYLALPGVATIALFNTLVFWNDWWLPLMLVTDPAWYNLQYLMYRIQIDIQYLTQMASNLSGVSGDILQRLPSKTAQMAMCVMTIGPIVLAYPFFQRFFVKGITIGSIKE
jgi:putative aldouronate transport system permease protein